MGVLETDMSSHITEVEGVVYTQVALLPNSKREVVNLLRHFLKNNKIKTTHCKTFYDPYFWGVGGT